MEGRVEDDWQEYGTQKNEKDAGRVGKGDR